MQNPNSAHNSVRNTNNLPPPSLNNPYSRPPSRRASHKPNDASQYQSQSEIDADNRNKNNMDSDSNSNPNPHGRSQSKRASYKPNDTNQQSVIDLDSRSTHHRNQYLSESEIKSENMISPYKAAAAHGSSQRQSQSQKNTDNLNNSNKSNKSNENPLEINSENKILPRKNLICPSPRRITNLNNESLNSNFIPPTHFDKKNNFHVNSNSVHISPPTPELENENSSSNLKFEQ